MTVSVVIPTYRAAGFIRRTLASVFAQTRLPDEVIVVDDHSPDDTVAVVRQVAAAAPVPVRVIVLARNSGGPARPLNVGIAAARGDLIAPLDHDDEFLPGKIEDQAGFLARCPGLGLVFGEIDSIRVDGTVCAAHHNGVTARMRAVLGAASPVEPDGFRIPSSAAYNALVAFPEIAQTCGNLLFPKAVWHAVGGFDERYRATCDLQLVHAVSRRFDVGYLPRKTVRWHQSPTCLSGHIAVTGVQAEEVYRLLLGMCRRRLSAANRALLREQLCCYASGIAFGLRNESRYLAAARWYATSFFGGRRSGDAVVGLAKLAPHYLARWFRGRRQG